VTFSRSRLRFSRDESASVRAYNAPVCPGIIADDLTGSCDVAARATHLGYQPLVAVRPDVFGHSSWESITRLEGPVVVVNTRSRDGRPQLATARARAAAANLERSGLWVIYQKIDSTLRGHWPEELKAITKVIRPDRVLICPAFPGQGRFVRHGRLYVRRSRAPGLAHLAGIEPARDVGAILKTRCGWPSETVELETVRRGARAIRNELRQRATAQCVVFDAEDDHDLRTIGRAFSNSTDRLLWVGSAGLISYVLPKRSRSAAAPAPQSRSPWLLIQGSRQPISHAQFQRLKHGVGVRIFKLLVAPDEDSTQALLERVLAGLAGGHDIAVVAPKRFDADIPARLARLWGTLVRRVSEVSALGGIFATGGSTAEAVCDSLRVRWLRVAAEVRPGIALSVALDGRRPGLPLVTKAGGFGGPGEVLRILKRCRRGIPREKAKAMRGNHYR
jgi:uncharacterized protein YgbK (DUF1537 family)